MDRNFERALSLVLKDEGGFVNHKKDPGGATNLGVTIGTARRLGIDVDGDGDTDIIDIKLLKPKDAAKVYRAEYWNKVKGDELPDGLDYAVFDFAVNSGPSRAAKHLQKALGVVEDGIIGHNTLGRVSHRDAAVMIGRVCDSRMAFLKRLKTWDTFGKGWSRRVAGVRSEAVKMAAGKPVRPVPASPAPEVAPTLEPTPKGTPKVHWLVAIIETILAFFRKARK